MHIVQQKSEDKLNDNLSGFNGTSNLYILII